MKRPAPRFQLVGLLCLALALVTLALYLPSLRHEFIAYDDQQYVTENPHVLQGVTGSGLVWAFGFHASNWHPLTWLSHMLDCQLYGAKPAGHHLTNVLLHVANSLLLFLLLQRLTGAVWRSGFVAALFAWHPLHVESVAWVAERKDVLSAFFFLLTLWAYARYVGSSGEAMAEGSPKAEGATLNTQHATRYYLLTLVLFTLALMSKPMVVTLPFGLLLLDFWPLRRFPSSTCGSLSVPLARLLLEKLPFVVLTALACTLTLAAQESAMVSTAGLRISQRAEHALISYVHYLGALVAPRGMAIYYPYDKAIPGAELLVCGVLLALLTLLAFRFAKRGPYLATGWLWFLGMLVPVIGLVQVGDQAWADRYSYLPSIGFFIAIVWVLGDLAQRSQSLGLVLRCLAPAVGVAVLVSASVQLSHWRDTRSLFEHAARVTRNNPLAATLLGSILAKEGKLDQAIEYYRTALRYSPGFPEAHFFLGHAFERQEKLDEALAQYQKALWFKPFEEASHIRIAAILAKQQKIPEAIAHYFAALKINPESPVAHNNLARLFHSEGRLEEAITHYSAALEFDPGLAHAHNNLGVLLLQKGQPAEATAHLREAVHLQPADRESQINLAQALVQQEQWSEAADLFARVVTPATADPNVHCQFALALYQVGKTREAMSHFAAALLLQQDLPAALDGLSWILATSPEPQFRNGTEAVPMAKRACELTGRKDAAKLKTLAAAYAEAGHFSEAAATVQAAQELAGTQKRQSLAEQCRQMQKAFQSSQAWRAGEEGRGPEGRGASSK